MKEFRFEETVLFLGENDAENWSLIDKYKRFSPNYIWIHLQSFPSGHLIILHDSPSSQILRYGAQICKENTKFRDLKGVKVSYTKLGNLIKGEKVGQVYFKVSRLVQTLSL